MTTIDLFLNQKMLSLFLLNGKLGVMRVVTSQWGLSRPSSIFFSLGIVRGIVPPIIWVPHIAKVGCFFSPSSLNVEWPILGPLPFSFYQKLFIFRFLENCFWKPNLYIAVGWKNMLIFFWINFYKFLLFKELLICLFTSSFVTYAVIF